MKKMIILALISSLTVAMVGCGQPKDTKKEEQPKSIQQTQQTPEAKGENIIKSDDMGLAYVMPKIWEENKKTNVLNIEAVGGGAASKGHPVFSEMGFSYIPQSVIEEVKTEAKKVKTQEEMMPILQKMMDNQRPICAIKVLDHKLTEKEKEQYFTLYNKKEKLGETKDLEFYFLSNDTYDTKGLSDEEKAMYEKLYSEVDGFKDSIQVYEPKVSEEKIKDSKNIGDFQTKTIDGKKVDQSMFKDYKITMIDVWETTCGPCIQEMPELEKLYEDVKKEGINVVGIVEDAKDEQFLETAKMILDKKGVQYMNIAPDEHLEKGILKLVTGTPTKIFVDNKGNIIGQPMVGQVDKKELKKVLENLSKGVQ